MKEYDVIIAGARFAGLSVASRLRGKKVLLIDREDIGVNNRSACGTLVRTMKEVGCKEAIIQEFSMAAIHIKNTRIDISLPEKFCTIDFEKFCELMNSKNDAIFMKAAVTGTDGRVVYTSKGNFKGNILVDCTGWRAVLASSLDEDYFDKEDLSFGIETEIEHAKDNFLHFFINHDIIKEGVLWMFPCNKFARFGVGSYKGDTKLLESLRKFVRSYRINIGKVHGGYFPNRIRNPIVKNVFVVGDAAGQALPLTGEGIRKSIENGLFCGEIISKILEKKISLEDGKKEYEKLVLRSKKSYDRLSLVQKIFSGLSERNIVSIGKLLNFNSLVKYIWRRYERI